MPRACRSPLAPPPSCPSKPSPTRQKEDATRTAERLEMKKGLLDPLRRFIPHPPRRRQASKFGRSQFAQFASVRLGHGHPLPARLLRKGRRRGERGSRVRGLRLKRFAERALPFIRLPRQRITLRATRLGRQLTQLRH